MVCFLSEPTPEVRAFLDLPNITIEVIPDVWQLKWQPTRDLARILRRYRPEILHLQFTGFISPYPWLARFYCVKRVIITDQASKPEGFVPCRAPWWKRVATRIINYPLDHVTCISDYVMHCWAILDVLPANRFLRIYNHVDFTRCQFDGSAFRRKLGIPEGRPVVMQVSWIIPDKGFDDLLDAARIVVERNPAAYFVFVGEGADRERYMRQTIEMGLQDHVAWTGIVSDPMRQGAYAAADVVCQVSRWEEGFGFVIAEAMASGKPAHRHPRGRHPGTRPRWRVRLPGRPPRPAGDRRAHSGPARATPISAAAWAKPAASSPSATSTPTPTSPNSSSSTASDRYAAS